MESTADSREKITRFEALVLPHLDSAFNLARWMARNTTDAEDVAQEAMMRAFRFFDTFRGEDARVWLLTIVRNTYLTWVRRQLPQQNSAEFDERLHTDIETALTPESEFLRQATAEQVRRAIENLPAEFREVILMRELEQLSYKEIAAVTRSPLGTVMSRISRGRSMLRQLIAGERRMEVKHHG
ncbi:MAG TPA: sigma-70 family RNA polymerase sigma factor [Terriglobales bacterium]|jgi:RNA polymerase sigma-70 factor (ECF subfamily)|nr:sigma-70 family RNA polymerase sigma factor [Terriglobales bacterium]